MTSWTSDSEFAFRACLQPGARGALNMSSALRLDHGPGLKPPCRPDHGPPGYTPGREIIGQNEMPFVQPIKLAPLKILIPPLGYWISRSPFSFKYALYPL